MLILGVYYGYGVHDSHAVLLEDNNIVSACEEGRLTGVKHDSSFPLNSVCACLKIANKQFNDIDIVVFPWDSKHISKKTILTKEKYEFYEEQSLFPFNSFFTPTAQIKEKNYVPHHMAHAALATLTSPFEESTYITIDAGGMDDYKSCSIGVFDGSDIKEITNTTVEHSIGSFYGTMTNLLGFKVADGEGKTMGLSCYGDSEKVYDILSPMIKLREDGLGFITEISFGHFIEFDLNMYNFEKGYRSIDYITSSNLTYFTNLLKNFKKEDIAAGTQRVLEERVCELIKNAVNKTGINNVCLSGGVFLNVKLNKKIRELPEIDRVYIPPAPHDAGLGLGAALYIAHEQNIWERKTISSPYFGSEFSDTDIQNTIKQYNLFFQILDNPCKTAAELIADGKVIGWFQGRSEFGPRALGNRSVLADPRRKDMRDKINHILKKRDWFMPFAPAMLDDMKEMYLKNPDTSPYMIMAYDVIDDKKNDIISATHIDGSCRPQTVTKQSNELFYNLIYEFYKLTGVPVILNTSFNRHGLPIVETPQKAIEHLIRSDIEELIIGKFLVKRDYLQEKKQC